MKKQIKSIIKIIRTFVPVRNNRYLTLLALSALLFTAGCSSTNISPALVTPAVATLVSYGVQKYPQAVPGVLVAKEVVCSAANGTNISPSAIVAAINGAGSLTPEAVFIVNGALVLYIGIYESYGADAINKNEKLVQYLRATCIGIEMGLPQPSTALRAIATTNVNWPLVRFK